MNKIYRLVWNCATGQWTPASELSRARGKRGRSIMLVAALMGGAAQAGEVPEEPVLEEERESDALVVRPLLRSTRSDVTFADATEEGRGIVIGTGAVTGDYAGSTTIGYKASAYEAGATAVGGSSYAGFDSTSLGWGARALVQAVSVGSSSQAADYGVAVGPAAHAMGTATTAIGWSAKTSLDSYSIAVGNDTKAMGYASMAVGSSANATGANSLALGANSEATAEKATALGKLARAVHLRSVALGAESVTSADNSVSVGSGSLKRRIMNVASGVDDSDAVTMAQLKPVLNRTQLLAVNTAGSVAPSATGTGALALGSGAQASKTNAVAIGTGARSAAQSQVIGDTASAEYESSVAIGSNATARSGPGAVAIGRQSVAAGGATAVGWGANAAEANAVAIGYEARAYSAYSIAIGRQAETGENDYATAMGYKARAIGVSSLATGADAQANGGSATAVGANSRATGIKSTTLGHAAIAAHDGSAALGAGSLTSAANTVSVGNDTLKRRIMNVAAGTADSDAVAFAQLKQTDAKVASNLVSLGKHETLLASHDTALTSLRTDIVGAGKRIDNLAQISAEHTRQIADLSEGTGGSPFLAVGTTNPKDAQATAESSIALGDDASASADGSVALGSHSHADQANTVSVGNAGSGLTRKLVNVSDGTADSDAATFGQVKRVDASVDGLASEVRPTLQAHTDALAALNMDSGNLGNVFAYRSTPGGTAATALGEGDIAIGTGSKADSRDPKRVDASASVAIGESSTAMAGATALGAGSRAAAGSTVLGRDAEGGARSVVLGAKGRAALRAIAIGGSSTASGVMSLAIGEYAEATDDQASTFGNSSRALDKGALAIGASSLANKEYAIALGFEAVAKANSAVALGSKSEADEDYTVSIGHARLQRRITNLADGINPTDAVNLRQLSSIKNTLDTRIDGLGTRVDEMDEHLVVKSSRAQESLALGNYAVSNADLSVALGSFSLADEANVVSIGNAKTGLRRKVVNVAEGTAASDAATFGQVNTVGLRVDAIDGELRNVVEPTLRAHTTAIDALSAGAGSVGRYVSISTNSASVDAVSAGLGSLAIGDGAVANGPDPKEPHRASYLEGGVATAIGKNASALGGGIALGGGSQAVNGGTSIGFNAESGIRGLALGRYAKSGLRATAIGDGAVASGGNSIAIGENSEATSDQSYAFGTISKALNKASLAIGASAFSNKEFAIALGFEAAAKANSSVALGSKSEADEEFTVSIGHSRLQRRLTNLADGINPTDAVNLRQLTAVRDTLDTRMDGLDKRIDEVVSDRIVASTNRAFARLAAQPDANVETPVAAADPTQGAAPVAATPAIVHNVAAGEAPTDAVNVAQMNTQRDEAIQVARSYTDERVDAVKQDVDDLRKDVGSRFQQVDRRIDRMAAMSGAYAGMAMNTAGLDGANRVGAGVGSQRGQKAIAVGYQHVFGGRASFSIGGAAGGSDRSVNAGAGFSW